MASQPTSEKCSWCGAAVEQDDGFRAYEAAGERRAVFCRLEHIVPWSIQGPHWEAGVVTEPSAIDDGPISCSHCGKELGEFHVLLVRHRGEHRVADDFCSTDHMAEWAKSGGRWQ
ncbi:MAG: hypothetical protein AABM29_09665 [Actinomycetota bacterium]